jgi:hypothetical protein
MMKILACIVALSPAFILLVVDGVKCGGPLSSNCLGDSNIRYDPDAASNAAVDQPPVWKKFQGYFMGTGTFQIVPEGS